MKSIIVAVTLLTGCVRPAGRDLCYAKADAVFIAAYVEECKGHESTADCPAAARIEADHQKAQEACP